MNTQNPQTKSRDKNQRGAALITVLMMSTLMLATGGVLVLVTGLSNRTAIDATAERQAYYSAESGVQDTLNVLRGNVNPQAGMPAGSQIDFLKAVTAADSNRPGDNSGLLRLSGWLNYSYTAADGEQRVPLTNNYSPLNGLAYSVLISDPDIGSTPVGTEPTRLLIRVRGFGPKGAEKRLEAIIRRTTFDYSPPAMLMMRGADDCAAMSFEIGQSNAKDYSGHDRNGSGILPAFGSTCDGDLAIEQSSDGKETVELPKAAKFDNPTLPIWLRSANDARTFVQEQREDAERQDRYFTSFDGNAAGFTFVDGDCDLDGGSGLLIVTGTLTMKGNPNFDGLILVLGEGRVERDGGGEGDIYGAMAVARFNSTGGFLPPFFDTAGGGNSTMRYDSRALREALNAAGPRVVGIHEY
ncbi:MAG TPA: pilus assembly PilX N-terminal domain-containing protein [Pyrinomonadaceae bacterium]|nr:pilus assembly PilX N-terminal domain-containing protein [Pyrinomonadaceae bacterium]